MIERARQLPLVGATIVAGLAMLALAFAFIWRAHDQAQLTDVASQNCLAIESLKAEFRKEARDDYRNLKRNAELLGITVTPQIRKAARESRDATLRRFAPIEC